MSSSVSIRLILEEPTVSNIATTSATEKIVQEFIETLVKHVRVIYDTCMRLSAIITQLHDNNMSKQHVGIINSASTKINDEIKRIWFKNNKKSWSKDSHASNIRYVFDYVLDCLKEINREIITTDVPETFDAVVDQIDFRCTREMLNAISQVIDEEDETFGARINAAFTKFNIDLGSFVNGPGLRKLEASITKDFKNIVTEIERDAKTSTQYEFSMVPEQRVLDKIETVTPIIVGSTMVVEYLKSLFPATNDNKIRQDAKQTLERIKTDIVQLTQLSSQSIDDFFELLMPTSPWTFNKFLSASERLFKNYYSTKFAGMKHADDPRVYHRNAIIPVNVMIDNVGYIVKTFESYIKTTNKSIDKFATATGKSPLGKLAFPGSRNNKKLPVEPNTQTENELFNDLVAHFEGSELLDKEKSNLIRKFLQKGNYHDVFKEPKVATLYRGMGVKSTWLAKALKLNVKELGRKGSLEKSFTFTPNRGGSSWTSDIKTARNFGHNNATSDFDSYVVIMHANVDKNPSRFIVGPGGLYNVDGFDTHIDEKESIGLGPIKVSKITWEV